MTDITELILDDHRRIRQLRQALHDTARDGPRAAPGGALAEVWDTLAQLIELHLSAEQEICWLPMCGTSPPGRQQLAAAAAAAADITAAIGEARLQPTGAPCWQLAVNDALAACAAQFRQEEDHILPRFARLAGGRPASISAASGWHTPKPGCWIRPRPGRMPRRAGPAASRCPTATHHAPDARDRAVRCTCQGSPSGHITLGIRVVIANISAPTCGDDHPYTTSICDGSPPARPAEPVTTRDSKPSERVPDNRGRKGAACRRPRSLTASAGPASQETHGPGDRLAT